MKEKLIIKNFGPIKSIDLDLGKITVFIGEQATGKSTIAKVLSICRYFSYIVDDSTQIVDDKSSFVSSAFVEWELNGFENDKTYIKYINEDYEIEIFNKEIELEDKRNIKSLIPNLKPKSEKFTKLIKDYNDLKLTHSSKFSIDKDWSIPYKFLATDVKKVMNNPFYIPAERVLQSIFSLGKSSIQNLSDSLFNQFVSLDKVLKGFEKNTLIDPLDIEYKNIRGIPHFHKKGNKFFYRLSQGASGYQSIIPIVLAVKYYSEIKKRRRTFIVEEPELNLFPKTQKKLVEFFSETVNKYNNQFILPTHSPYIITPLENLMYAYQLGNADDGRFKEEVVKIIDQRYWINPDDVNAYYLEDGIAKDIMLREESLIKKNELDEVSDVIGNVTDKLLAIEQKLSITEIDN